ncbi:putative Dynamin protein dnm1 [Dioszegia hungarica]|uniref:Dynamin protein dnm1 n=1 Tax=Dioszegia hungarica TaxID=4972 RepID=A0AA38LPR4_9TREE|nr:putative Dynamin protein dnm1 [Dioszegia hungarica]KAI9632427.1 putative Dynamin protein dnm1 [Dioszegia hungarica]
MSMDGDLIAIVNRLQDTFNHIGGDALDLPQIVVVGSQSSGKSSVLETIVGRDFLPRGQGIVTRRPLVLQLIHTPASGAVPSNGNADGYLPNFDAKDPAAGAGIMRPGGSRMGGGMGSGGAEYAEFLHLNRRFTDFEEIRKEIEAETYRVAGQNKGVSKLPINLKIYGPGVLNLTLVDLPGLTKVPVGDQPTDIERQIKSLVLDYISKPNSVILAVSPANVDLANSDSLKLARSVDPRGLRTLGVLTKLDLMDAGTNALDILTGRTYPLKLGFVGVVNRSQQDIMSDVPMEDARRKEEEFFKGHPVYRNLAHRCGTKFLAKTLNGVLMAHIREKLPDMKARLNTLMGQTQQELNAFGDATFLGEQHRGSLILKLMTEFSKDFVSSIDGTSLEISTKELSGGARIYYIFNDVFGHALTCIDPAHNLSLGDIRTAIRNSTGPRPSLFVPEVAFDLLVKPQIKLLEGPSLRCVELVYEELMKICHNCTSPELQRFPRLLTQLVEVVSELLRERLGPTSEYVSSLIGIQAAYINTNHPDFQAGSAAIARAGPAPQVAQKEPSRASSQDDEDEESGSEPETRPTNSNLNGPPQAAHHPRAASTSIPDARRPNKLSGPGSTDEKTGASGTLGKSSRRHQRTASGSTSTPSHLLAPQPHTAASLVGGGSPHTAKETFLNYFFGGPGGGGQGGEGGMQQMRQGQGQGQGHDGRQSQGQSQGQMQMDILPDLGSRRGTMSRASGLESSGAYDMRSLGKHIDLSPADHPFQLSPREEMETTLIRSLIASYFNITRQTIQDLVPKAIMHLLVNFSRESIQQRLVTSLYKPDLFAELLFEDEALVAERTRVKSLLDAYKEAFKILSEVSLKGT